MPAETESWGVPLHGNEMVRVDRAPDPAIILGAMFTSTYGYEAVRFDMLLDPREQRAKRQMRMSVRAIMPDREFVHALLDSWHPDNKDVVHQWSPRHTYRYCGGAGAMIDPNPREKDLPNYFYGSDSDPFFRQGHPFGGGPNKSQIHGEMLQRGCKSICRFYLGTKPVMSKSDRRKRDMLMVTRWISAAWIDGLRYTLAIVCEGRIQRRNQKPEKVGTWVVRYLVHERRGYCRSMTSLRDQGLVPA